MQIKNKIKQTKKACVAISDKIGFPERLRQETKKGIA